MTELNKNIEPNRVYINKYQAALYFLDLWPNKLINKNSGKVVDSNSKIKKNKLNVLKLNIKRNDKDVIKNIKYLIFNILYFKSFQLLNKDKGVKNKINIINKYWIDVRVIGPVIKHWEFE